MLNCPKPPKGSTLCAPANQSNPPRQNLQITGEPPILSRKPAETVVTNLQIKESLRSALEREADKNQVSLNREMTRRLEESLENADKLVLHRIRDDMEIIWLRYSERFLELELEQGILTALEQRDYETARRRAITLRKTQANAARQQAAKIEGIEYAEWTEEDQE